MHIAYSDRENPKRDFTTEDILAALARQVPLSKSHSEAIDELRKWLAEGRAQSASLREDPPTQGPFGQIQLDPPPEL